MVTLSLYHFFVDISRFYVMINYSQIRKCGEILMNPDKRIRRLQNLLYMSGIGTILFSIWTGIRGIVTFLPPLQNYPIENMDETSIFLIKLIMNIFIFVLFFFIILIYFCIGKAAISISFGKQCSFRFIFFCLLLLTVSIISYVYDFFITPDQSTIRMQDIAMTVLDLTANIILIEIVVFSIKLNRLRTNVCK